MFDRMEPEYDMKLRPVVVPLDSVEKIEIMLGREGRKMGLRAVEWEAKLYRSA